MISDDDFKWDGSIFCRHGGENHPFWWVLHRNFGYFLQMNNTIMDDISIESVDVCIYVRILHVEMELLRDQFMKYIGGQRNVQFSKHRLPLIVSKENNTMCYQNIDHEDVICGRKILLRCPDLQCNCGICKKCLDNISSSRQHFIQPNDYHIPTDGSNGHSNHSSDSDNIHSSSIDNNDLDFGAGDNFIPLVFPIVMNAKGCPSEFKSSHKFFLPLSIYHAVIRMMIAIFHQLKERNFQHVGL